MSALQGFVDYPGLTTFTMAEYVLSNGISPGVCSIEMPIALAGDLEPFGDLTLSYGDVEITLPGCAYDQAHIDNSLGGQICRVQIWDRRWQWKVGGYIYGHYNVRMPTGTTADEGFNSAARTTQDDSTFIRKGTEMAPQDLATLCLQAMGEDDYDVSALPNATRPEIGWSYINPAEALQQLCEGLGCRVTYVVDSDSVTIVSIGQGENLPDNGLQTFPSIGINPPETPSSLLLVGGATIFEGFLPLEPVGIDKDGSIQDIDFLSYAPDNGWESEDPDIWPSFSEEDDPTIYPLIEKSIYKMWRIWLPIAVPYTSAVTGDDGDAPKVTDIRQIHMYDRLIETHFDPSDPAKIIGKKPLLYGNFDEALRQEIKTQTKTPQAYRHDVTVDADRWLIITEDPLYTVDGSGEFQPATLYVKIAYSVRDLDTWEPLRWTMSMDLDSQADTQPQVVKREEIFLKVIGTFSETDYSYQNEAVDNMQTDDVQNKSQYYLQAAASEYIEQDSIDTEYAGLVDIQPDGLIQQVTHTIKAGSGGYTKTRASLAVEHNPYVLPWAARRRVEGARLTEREQLEKDCPFMRQSGPFRTGAF